MQNKDMHNWARPWSVKTLRSAAWAWAHDRLLINHDLWLDNVSDVARRFPGRQREDGHFYVIDFDLDEILTLSVTERFTVVDGKDVAVFLSDGHAFLQAKINPLDGGCVR